MIGAVVAFIIGALITLGAFLLVCEALPQWRYWNQRINRDVQTLQNMPYADEDSAQ